MQSFHHSMLVSHRQVLTSHSNPAQLKFSLTWVYQYKKFRVPFSVKQFTICIWMCTYNTESLCQMCLSSHTFLWSLVESYLFSIYLRKEMIRCLRFAETVITLCIKSACVGENIVTTKCIMQNNQSIWLIPIQNTKRVGRFISFLLFCTTKASKKRRG